MNYLERSSKLNHVEGGYLSNEMNLTKDPGSDSTTVKWKLHINIFAVTNFPPILGAHNPFLSTKRRREIPAHMSRVADEYVEMGKNKIQLLKARSLRKGTRR